MDPLLPWKRHLVQFQTSRRVDRSQQEAEELWAGVLKQPY